MQVVEFAEYATEVAIGGVCGGKEGGWVDLVDGGVFPPEARFGEGSGSGIGWYMVEFDLEVCVGDDGDVVGGGHDCGSVDR